ncbi:hypothetical protein [Rufibacter radiotolerans]|uniref:hypothetical protein n=1 Tax=Rufibacter radiotolerans TaxID=1379910 RepID=UPI000AD65CA6|nr:hypothetical protein [Rufibacter radiotolerans]
MDRREIDWFDIWNYRRFMQQEQDHQDRPDYDMRGEYQYPQHHRNDFDRFGQDYSRYERQHMPSAGHYRPHLSGAYPSQSNYSQGRFGQHYQTHFRPDHMVPRWEEDQEIRNESRRGHGSLGYGGTSDQFDNVRREHRYRYQQEEQDHPYAQGRGERTRHSGPSGPFGWQAGRINPSYGNRSFYDSYNAERGSTYGGASYAGGQGYKGSQQQDDWHGPSYGVNTGNNRGSTYGHDESTYSRNNPQGYGRWQNDSDEF